MRESILGDHALPEDPRTMTTTAQAFTTSPKERHLFVTDDATPVPHKDTMRTVTQKQKVDKRSPEYLLKSGFAGGLAGCAVCCTPPDVPESKGG